MKKELGNIFKMKGGHPFSLDMIVLKKIIHIIFFLGYLTLGFSLEVTLQLPENKKEIGIDSQLTLTFSGQLQTNFEKFISVTSGGKSGLYTGVQFEIVAGTWILVNPNEIRFTSQNKFKLGDLIMITIENNLKSNTGESYTGQSTFSYLVDDGINFPYTTDEYIFKSVLRSDGVLHEIPITIFNPITTEPHPVIFWVHGGGWGGGTPALSVATNPEQGDYLTSHLGIASVGIAYRCRGSQGTFAQAMEDVSDAINEIKKNAAKYNIDTTRMGLYGGSAGTPLSSLTAQRFEGIISYAGYNGIYNFVENPNSNFGNGNSYQQGVPSRAENSSIYNLKIRPPNTLLLHGDIDPTINYTQSTLFADSIKSNGGQAKALIYSNEVHAFFNVNREMELPTLFEVKNHWKTTLAKNNLGIFTAPMWNRKINRLTNINSAMIYMMFGQDYLGYDLKGRIILK